MVARQENHRAHTAGGLFVSAGRAGAARSIRCAAWRSSRIPRSNPRTP
jgi:hypothetical protein